MHKFLRQNMEVRPYSGFHTRFFVGGGGRGEQCISAFPPPMRIAIEGPVPEFVDFDAILDILKQSNRQNTI